MFLIYEIRLNNTHIFIRLCVIENFMPTLRYNFVGKKDKGMIRNKKQLFSVCFAFRCKNGGLKFSDKVLTVKNFGIS
jgi:hypothetical protein